MTSEAVRKTMQANKRKDTKPELLVRQRLREAGLTGYRLQWKVPGRPDVAWPGKKVALFVNGCFWHRCPHCQLPLPKSNIEYWSVKFERNMQRDERNLALLEEEGWKVHTIWECQLKKKTIEGTFAQLLPLLADELGKPISAHAIAQSSAQEPAQASAQEPAQALQTERADDSSEEKASEPLEESGTPARKGS